jgi:hypothetical protein
VVYIPEMQLAMKQVDWMGKTQSFISTEDLSVGIYLIQITTKENLTLSQKFVKQ